MNYFQRFGQLSVVCIAIFGGSVMSATIHTEENAVRKTQAYDQIEQTPTTVAQRLITSIEKERVFKDILDADQQKHLLEVLHRVADRAPRDSTDGCDVNGCGTSFAGPCGNSASADLQVIQQTLCCIKNTIGTPCGICCVDDACAELQTLFGLLACICSKIDLIMNGGSGNSGIEILESKLDICCTQLNSKIDVVDSAVDVIDSKLDACCAQLNSKIDSLFQSCTDISCCVLNSSDITFSTDAITAVSVLSVDWSFDSKYVVVGYESNGASNQDRVQVFSYSGGVLTAVATYSDTLDSNVNAVRFSPINYQIMVARDQLNTSSGTLQTYLFSPLIPSLAPQGTGISLTNEDFVSVAWHPEGTYVVAAHNSPAGSPTTSVVTLYDVNTVTGDIGVVTAFDLSLTASFPGAIAASLAIDWNDANPLYAAVGTRQSEGVGGEDLFVLQFDSSTAPTSINAFGSGSFGIQAFANFADNPATRAVSWHPSGDFLAAGADFPVTNDHVQVFTFDASVPSLTFLTSIPLATESGAIFSLDWDPITGDVLSYSTSHSTGLFGLELYINYCFSSINGTLSFLNEFPEGMNGQPLDVRWSPNEKFSAVGRRSRTTGDVFVYNLTRPNCFQVMLRLLCSIQSCSC